MVNTVNSSPAFSAKFRNGSKDNGFHQDTAFYWGGGRLHIGCTGDYIGTVELMCNIMPPYDDVITSYSNPQLHPENQWEVLATFQRDENGYVLAPEFTVAHLNPCALALRLNIIGGKHTVVEIILNERDDILNGAWPTYGSFYR